MNPYLEITHTLSTLTDNHWYNGIFVSAFVLLCLFILWRYGTELIIAIITKTFKITSGTVAHAMISGVNKTINRLFLMIALSAIIHNFPFSDRIHKFTKDGFFLISLLIIIGFIFHSIDAFSQHLRNRGAREFEPLVNKVLKAAFLTLFLMIGMGHFGYDIWHIVTALGIGSLAVGLAAQPTLSNMIAGFTILIDRPFTPGDRISLASGEVGDVVLVGMRSTRIHTLDGNMLIVPNNDLSNSRVVNYNLPNDGLTQRVRFYFDYELDIHKIKGELLEVTKKITTIYSDTVSVNAATVDRRGFVEINIAYRVRKYADASGTTDAVIERCLNHIKENKIPIARDRLETFLV